MTGVGKMDSKSVGDGFAGVCFSVVIDVAEFPDIGDDRGVNIAIVMENSGGDSCDLILEVLGIDGGLVGETIAIGVFDEVDALAEDLEVEKVILAILVEIFDPPFIGGAVFGRENSLIKGAFVVG